MQYGSGMESLSAWSSEVISMTVIDYVNILRRKRKTGQIRGSEVISVNKLRFISYFMHF